MIKNSQRLARALLGTLGMATAAVTTLAAERPHPTPPVEQRAVAAVGSDAWRQLETSHWIADGRTGARVVYVFTDLNCPYCNKLWSDARPWVNSGKVQLRHVIVGILTPTSPGKAAALLADKDPSATLAAYEGQNAFTVATALASGRPRPLADGMQQPLAQR